MRLKRICVALTALAFGMTLIAAPAMAERGKARWADRDRPGREDRERPNRIDRMTERLELTAEQRDAIEKIMESGRAKAVEHRKEMARLRHEMKGEMLKDDPSEAALARGIEKIGAHRTKRQIERMKDRMAIRRLLTPEQRDRQFMIGSRHWFGEGDRMAGPKRPGKRGMHRMPDIRRFGILREGGLLRDRSALEELKLDLDLGVADLIRDLDLDLCAWDLIRDLDLRFDLLRDLPGMREREYDTEESLPREDDD